MHFLCSFLVLWAWALVVTFRDITNRNSDLIPGFFRHHVLMLKLFYMYGVEPSLSAAFRYRLFRVHLAFRFRPTISNRELFLSSSARRQSDNHHYRMVLCKKITRPRTCAGAGDLEL